MTLLVALVAALLLGGTVSAGPGPVLGGPLPWPLFPPDNWWNLDISGAPVDTASPSYINYINNGGTRRLHPDFGGEESTGSVGIYGIPYVVVDGTQPKLTVDFVDYGDESDAVGYPIPPIAITQPHWIEGGDPGNVDVRADQDRHLIIVDRDNQYLYELYNVWYNAASGRWEAGSGAFWDTKTNDRRPEGWTSADAAGLAILPGLVRYDEVYNPSVTDIHHAFRVTVRRTNGHVWPASHTAGSTSGALPMGGRLRLRASTDISGYTPEMQKIFRAMKRYGLIVADNGSDMYITGMFDTRWDNDILNPAFAGLKASDFEVIQLGWKPSTTTPPALAAIGVSPGTVTGGQSATGTVTLTASAPSGGIVVTLGSSNTGAATVPASVTVPAGSSSASFAVGTSAVTTSTPVVITAGYGGVSKTATVTVGPVPPPPPPPPPPAPAISSLALKPAMVAGGTPSTGTVTLTAAAPSGGVVVALSSSKSAASVPASVTVPAGKSSATFNVSTATVYTGTTVTISATLDGKTKAAALWIFKKRK